MVDGDLDTRSDSSVSSLEVLDFKDEKTSIEEKPKVKWVRSETDGGHESHLIEPPWYVTMMVRFAFTVMFSFGLFVDWLIRHGYTKVKTARDDPRNKGFGNLSAHYEQIYINHIVRKFSDVISRPICGVPGAVMEIRDRYTDDNHWSYKFTGTISKVVNLGSYNYLGFSHNDGLCAETAAEYVDRYGIHVGGTRHESGNHVAHKELERCVARYLGVEDAVCFPMGFGTNTMNIPSLVDKNSLILSDALNHASIVLGCRLSGAAINTFKHNDPVDCEKKLRDALCEPNPKTGRPYNKVLIIIEGIYSMEGTIVNLPEFLRVKKKYGAYIFLDEAHSVGALGPSGKGVVEYWGCNPRDVDIMMGTLTKSFAAAGGYMGGSKTLVSHVRNLSAGPCYGVPMSPPIIAQVLSSMKVMLGEDGTDIGARKAVQLQRNSRYFRTRLRQMGFLVYGHDDSPVVPLMTFYISKVVEFSRLTLKRNIGLVAVGYPATSETKARVRFCLSADHTKEQLDYVLSVVNEVGDITATKYAKPEFVNDVIEY